jgi:hypothetical protein
MFSMLRSVIFNWCKDHKILKNKLIYLFPHDTWQVASGIHPLGI